MLEIYDRDKQERLISEAKNMKRGEIEEMWLVSVYSMSSYLKALFSFGAKSKVTKDNLNVIKEMFSILKTERSLLNFIIRNLDKFDLNATENIINMLDDLNDKTVEYYYSVIDDLEDAADIKEELRGTRPKKDFPTLIQSNTYSNEVIALALNKKAIREFLGYEEEFWEFIKDKDHGDIKISYEIAEKISYAVPLSNGEDKIQDVKFMIPEVIDLPTALLAIRTYQRVYDIYKSIGKERGEIEKSHTKELEFETEYLPAITSFQLHKKKQS